MRSSVRALTIMLALCAAESGCALVREPLVSPEGLDTSRTLVLNGHALRVHVADARRDTVAAPRPLVVYATGDRGWAGKDYDVYRHLVSWGYPVAGFDARDYVTHLGGRDMTTPARLAKDFESIIQVARTALAIEPDRPVILVGVSRGADLVVVAAGQLPLQRALDGVIAAGLTHEEEFVTADGPGDDPASPATALPYECLPLLGDVPVTVIQSTNDEYVPAAEAQKMFGPETERRRLVAVEADNHSFGGARSVFYGAMQDALVRMTPVMRTRDGSDAKVLCQAAGDLPDDDPAGRSPWMSRRRVSFPPH
jgi:pimeloyl-ACP methyl ester carboxylesterase